MISLIITVLNEKKNISAWFESIQKQSLPLDEIVIVDGGSDDGTWEYLQEVQKKISNLNIFKSSGNIAEGRNFAIRETKGNIIVVTDAGCVYNTNWLEKIVQPIVAGNGKWSATAFGPWFEPSDSLLVYSIAAATVPEKNEFKKDWLPSSRSVAFTKELWHTVGGYPEWIPYCEDVIFDLKIKKTVGAPAFIREPLVFWRPRMNLLKYCKQLYNYTRSEGHGNINFFRQLVRYGVYIGSVLIIVLAIIKSNWFWLPLFSGIVIYMSKFWRRWFSFTRDKNSIYQTGGLLVLPLAIVLGDISKMVGYLVGVFERTIGIIRKK
jgi:glycosyltransferase involved in cell wall biosynthesis